MKFLYLTPWEVKDGKIGCLVQVEDREDRLEQRIIRKWNDIPKNIPQYIQEATETDWVPSADKNHLVRDYLNRLYKIDRAHNMDDEPGHSTGGNFDEARNSTGFDTMPSLRVEHLSMFKSPSVQHDLSPARLLEDHTPAEPYGPGAIVPYIKS